MPGKPLRLIGGRTLLGRTVELARRAVADMDVGIFVATDDRRVADHAAGMGCAVVMTDGAITTGSARVLAAVRQLGWESGVVVNLQGDTPFLPSSGIRQTLAVVAAGAEVATAVTRLSWSALDALREQKRCSPFSGTTCVRRPDGRALWFSKQILPAIRNEAALRAAGGLSPVYRHVGVYAYTVPALSAFEAASPSLAEQLESLEQLRFFELDIDIHTVEVPPEGLMMNGIDSEADIDAAERLLALHGDALAS